MRADRKGAARAMPSRRTILLVTLAVAVAVLGVATRLFYDRLNAGEVGTAALGTPFSLVDHEGRPITEAAFEGQPSMLFFGFTHCPEICPTTVYDMEGWLEALGPEADALRAFFVTVDPERDTPEVLRDYLTYQTDRVLGISGEPEAVREMARGWRVYFARRDLDGGDYTMDHTSLVYLLDGDGRYAGTIPYGAAPEEAVAQLRALLAG